MAAVEGRREKEAPRPANFDSRCGELGEGAGRRSGGRSAATMRGEAPAVANRSDGAGGMDGGSAGAGDISVSVGLRARRRVIGRAGGRAANLGRARRRIDARLLGEQKWPRALYRRLFLTRRVFQRLLELLLY